MKLYGIGVGPGDPELVTLKAIRLIKEADVALAPVSAEGRPSVAWGIVSNHLDRDRQELIFPMTRDAAVRDEKLREQLRGLDARLDDSAEIAVPVIGDSALFATVAYLWNVWKELRPDLELELVPGVSAHSLAASMGAEFLALGEERLLVVPATADDEDLVDSLKAADAVALYKPSALGEALRQVVEAAGPWARMVRVHRAGLKGQRVVRGDGALEPTDDYLTVLLLWRCR
jgi:precorrin-2/cobalt-factor-2 C20-methyltransferase